MNLCWINMNFYYAILQIVSCYDEKNVFKTSNEFTENDIEDKKCQLKFSSQFHNSNIKKDKHISLDKQVKTFAILRRFYRINQPGYETCKL